MFGKHKVRISAELFERLQAASAQAGYATTEEFISHTLEQAAEKIQQQADQQIMDRQLRGLGYLE